MNSENRDIENELINEIGQVNRSNLGGSEDFDIYSSIENTIENIKADHISKISKLVIEELEQKHKFRISSHKIARNLLIGFIVLMIALYSYLMLVKYSFSDTLLIGITVTVFTSIIGLVTIIFKYSFSKTKDITDHLQETYINKTKK